MQLTTFCITSPCSLCPLWLCRIPYGLMTILPASVPDLPTVLSSCRRWAAAASVERHDAVDARLDFAGGEPAVDVVGGGALFVGRGVEHREAVEVAALHVERADGEHRAGVAAGHEDHAAARGEQRHGHFEVRLAERFPPDVDAVGGELL